MVRIILWLYSDASSTLSIPPAVDVQRQVLLLQGIIQLLTGRLGGGQRAFAHLYAMRMVNSLTGEIRCLHQDTTMYQVPMIPMVMLLMMGARRFTNSLLVKKKSGAMSCGWEFLEKSATKKSDSFSLALLNFGHYWRRPLHKRNKSLCLKIHTNILSFMLLFSNVPP